MKKILIYVLLILASFVSFSIAATSYYHTYNGKTKIYYINLNPGDAPMFVVRSLPNNYKYRIYSDNHNPKNIENGTVNGGYVAKAVRFQHSGYVSFEIFDANWKFLNYVKWNVSVKQLTRLEISGQSEVNENSTAYYKATAYYDDGSHKDVTNSTSWSDVSSKADIDRYGKLTTYNVDSDIYISISASYTENGVTKKAGKNVKIKNKHKFETSVRFMLDILNLETNKGYKICAVPSGETISDCIWIELKSGESTNIEELCSMSINHNINHGECSTIKNVQVYIKLPKIDSYFRPFIADYYNYGYKTFGGYGVYEVNSNLFNNDINLSFSYLNYKDMNFVNEAVDIGDFYILKYNNAKLSNAQYLDILIKVIKEILLNKYTPTISITETLAAFSHKQHMIILPGLIDLTENQILEKNTYSSIDGHKLVPFALLQSNSVTDGYMDYTAIPSELIFEIKYYTLGYEDTGDSNDVDELVQKLIYKKNYKIKQLRNNFLEPNTTYLLIAKSDFFMKYSDYFKNENKSHVNDMLVVDVDINKEHSFFGNLWKLLYGDETSFLYNIVGREYSFNYEALQTTNNNATIGLYDSPDNSSIAHFGFCLPSFDKNVDIYLGLQYDKQLAIINPDKTFNFLDGKIIPYRFNTKGNYCEHIYDNIKKDDLPKGHYISYILAVPTGTDTSEIKEKQLWKQSFDIEK